MKAALGLCFLLLACDGPILTPVTPTGPPVIPGLPGAPQAPPGAPRETEPAGLIVTSHGDSLFLQAGAVIGKGTTRTLPGFISNVSASEWGVLVGETAFSCGAGVAHVKGLTLPPAPPGVRIVAFNKSLTPAKARSLGLADERTAWLEGACNLFGFIVQIDAGKHYDFGVEVKGVLPGTTDFRALFDLHRVELAPGTDPAFLSTQIQVVP